MNRLFAIPQNLVSVGFRALLFSLMLAAPVLAVPAGSSNGQRTIIEASAPGNSGLGFVMLVMLQR